MRSFDIISKDVLTQKQHNKMKQGAGIIFKGTI